MANKVKFGLKNVHYAVATIADDGSATYGEVKPIRGAVNLSLDAQGDVTKFRADNIDYWVGYANNGYEGDLEIALIPDDFKIDILGQYLDDNNVMIEDSNTQPASFAMMFQFEGDEKATRHILYNVTCSRPTVAGATTEETIEPQTETLSLTATSVYNPDLDRDIVKASCPEGETAYSTWFDAVYEIKKSDATPDPDPSPDPTDPENP